MALWPKAFLRGFCAIWPILSGAGGRQNAGVSAENDRSHQSGMVVGVCVWCRSKYVVGCSRAHEQHIFCSKKCEIEGRFWLMELLRAIPRPRRNPEDIRGFGI